MIEGVEVGITIRQQPTGSYKVSVRTVTGVDASAICAHLGGGGQSRPPDANCWAVWTTPRPPLLTEVEKSVMQGI